MLDKRIGVIMYQTSNSKGQELVAQRMVRDFNKLGHQAYLITSTFHDGLQVVPKEGLLKDKGYFLVEDEVLHIPVIRVDSQQVKWPPRRIGFKDFIDTLNQIVDDYGLNVLITHSTLWNGPEDVAKFVTWRRDMKKVGGYQDAMVFCHMSHFQEPSSQRYSLSELTFRTAWNKISLSKVLETANLVLVVTPFEKIAKIRMGARAEQCLLYPGGVDNETFLRFAADDVSEFLKRRNIAPAKKLISYLGTLEDRKNPQAVLKIAQQLSARTDIHFILAGRGDSAYGKETIEQARKLANVSYLGEIDEREKILLIRASYLNILMSKLEALGISQLEFMYNGVPVVTSGVGGQAWVVQNGIEGLHAKGPADIAGAAAAILRLVEDDGLYRQLSKNSRERAAKYASINLTGELDTAINRELLRESGLSAIPKELQVTLTKPEHVLKSWKAGTAGIVATNRRLFIRRGLISQSVLSMRYQNIRAIEHLRRYPWKIPLTGAILSGLVFLLPALQSLLSPNFVDFLKLQIENIKTQIPAQLTSLNWFMALWPLIPFVISLIIFLAQARKGYQLYGVGSRPIYLSGRFRQAMELIRKIQDNDVSHLQSEESQSEDWETLVH
jgi:glycosyltransferase involved in cell wall biosynthesis